MWKPDTLFICVYDELRIPNSLVIYFTVHCHSDSSWFIVVGPEDIFLNSTPYHMHKRIYHSLLHTHFNFLRYIDNNCYSHLSKYRKKNIYNICVSLLWKRRQGNILYPFIMTLKRKIFFLYFECFS